LIRNWWGFFCYFGVLSVLALSTLVRRPKNWPLVIFVIVVGTSLGLHFPIRTVLHRPSSFDPIGDGFGILGECAWAYLYLGPIHLLITFGLIVDAVKKKREGRASSH